MRRITAVLTLLLLLTVPVQSICAAESRVGSALINIKLENIATSDTATEKSTDSTSSADTDKESQSETDSEEIENKKADESTAADKKDTAEQAAVSHAALTAEVNITGGTISVSDGTRLESYVPQYGQAVSAVLIPDRGYSLPTALTVSVGGQLLGSADYTYDSQTGVLTIPAARVTGNIVVSGQCLVAAAATTAPAASNNTDDSESVVPVAEKTAAVEQTAADSQAVKTVTETTGSNTVFLVLSIVLFGLAGIVALYTVNPGNIFDKNKRHRGKFAG
ncbi:MAG: hypothetical protein ACOYB8_01830 [Eubacteriaceae bacterium]